MSPSFSIHILAGARSSLMLPVCFLFCCSAAVTLAMPSQGKDSTSEFDDVGHSEDAKKDMEGMLIGYLAEVWSMTKIDESALSEISVPFNRALSTYDDSNHAPLFLGRSTSCQTCSLFPLILGAMCRQLAFRRRSHHRQQRQHLRPTTFLAQLFQCLCLYSSVLR